MTECTGETGEMDHRTGIVLADVHGWAEEGLAMVDPDHCGACDMVRSYLQAILAAVDQAGGKTARSNGDDRASRE